MSRVRELNSDWLTESYMVTWWTHRAWY